MRKILKTLFCCLLVIPLLVSCDAYPVPSGPGSGSTGGQQTSNDEYYVKYTVSTSYPNIFSNVTYATPYGTGEFMNYQTRSWSETVGPVKKGFKAWVQNANGTATCKIEVSKNNSPFATQATGTNSASFTINY